MRNFDRTVMYSCGITGRRSRTPVFAAHTSARSWTRPSARSRYHHVEFDRLDATRTQSHTLLALVHRGESTRFGREHDFRRIRTPDDFRRLVPLTTTADLWRERWEPALPHLNGATWPGAIALTGSPASPLPSTAELLEVTCACLSHSPLHGSRRPAGSAAAFGPAAVSGR